MKNNKYYIGQTTTPKKRIDEHFSNNGSAWTKKYKPIDVIEIIKDCDKYDENKHTIKYMEKYGIQNVRGGSFCQIILSTNTIRTINIMINEQNGKCFRCNNTGHFSNACKFKPKSTDIKNMLLQNNVRIIDDYVKFDDVINIMIDQNNKNDIVNDIVNDITYFMYRNGYKYITMQDCSRIISKYNKNKNNEILNTDNSKFNEMNTKLDITRELTKQKELEIAIIKEKIQKNEIENKHNLMVKQIELMIEEEISKQKKFDFDIETLNSENTYNLREKDYILAILCAKYKNKYDLENVCKEHSIPQNLFKKKVELYEKLIKDINYQPIEISEKKIFLKYNKMKRTELKELL